MALINNNQELFMFKFQNTNTHYFIPGNCTDDEMQKLADMIKTRFFIIDVIKIYDPVKTRFTKAGKTMIRNYFDQNVDLLNILEKQNQI